MNENILKAIFLGTIVIPAFLILITGDALLYDIWFCWCVILLFILLARRKKK